MKNKTLHVRLNKAGNTAVIQAGCYNTEGRWRSKGEVTKECLEAVRDLFIVTKNPEDKMNGVEFKDTEHNILYKLILAEYKLDETGEKPVENS